MTRALCEQLLRETEEQWQEAVRLGWQRWADAFRKRRGSLRKLLLRNLWTGNGPFASGKGTMKFGAVEAPCTWQLEKG